MLYLESVIRKFGSKYVYFSFKSKLFAKCESLKISTTINELSLRIFGKRLAPDELKANMGANMKENMFFIRLAPIESVVG